MIASVRILIGCLAAFFALAMLLMIVSFWNELSSLLLVCPSIWCRISIQFVMKLDLVVWQGAAGNSLAFCFVELPVIVILALIGLKR